MLINKIKGKYVCTYICVCVHYVYIYIDCVIAYLNKYPSNFICTVSCMYVYISVCVMIAVSHSLTCIDVMLSITVHELAYMVRMH